jgi:hypothetical protein
MSTADVQYISDEQGDLTAVIVPIALWKQIVSELETQYLLKSEAMKKRLLDARARDEGIGLNEVLEHLEIE